MKKRSTKNKNALHDSISNIQGAKTIKAIDLVKLFTPRYKSFGELFSVKNNCARIYGISDAFVSERLLVPSINATALVIKIEAKIITAIFLTNVKEVRPKLKIVRTAQTLGHQLESFDKLLGNIINTV